MRGQVEIASEPAYDLMQEHMGLVLQLLAGAQPVREVEREIGAVALRRLLRNGLVAVSNGQVQAVGNVYRQLRQESITNFFRTYLLPTAVSGSTQYIIHATLSEAWPTRAQELLDELSAASEGVVGSPVSARLTVIVASTTRSVADGPKLGLACVEAAGIQRALSDERELALLYQWDALVGFAGYEASLAAVTRCHEWLEQWRAPALRASHHVLLGLHWHGQLEEGLWQ